MQLREHQTKFAKELHQVLNRYNIAYLFGEVRSGKTLTALETARLFGVKKVLVVTKKKAISSIKSDHEKLGFGYELQAINYESLHKIEDRDFDLIIYDEAHSLGAFAKKSNRTKLAKEMFFKVPCILMTGTAAVESYSQFYHQFYVSAYSPFKEYSTFYKWAKVFVDKKELKLPTHTVPDYSHAKVEEIDEVIGKYIVRMTQDDAGFTSKVTEHIIDIIPPKNLETACKKLLKDKVLIGKTGFIFGDLPAKLKSKVHQIYNGHCIIEKDDGSTFTKIFSKYKANEIAFHFKGKKIAIMYYYKAELEILKEVFGDRLTTDLETFNKNPEMNMAIQQTSTEGMNLSSADCLVYMNLGFSGKNYLQSRDRLTVKDRENNDVYFMCEKGGITRKILKAVQNKKDFNSEIFKKEFDI